MSVQKLKDTILNKINKAAEKSLGQLPEHLELGFPPDVEFGHFAVGCFPLAKQFKKSPTEIAKRIAENINYFFRAPGSDPNHQDPDHVYPYTPYIYPHPMASDGDPGDTTAPAAPTGLSIVNQ